MKNKYSTAFKVVNMFFGHPQSYWTTKYSILYSKTVENFPSIKGSCLYLFDTLEHARSYMNDYAHLELWEVQAKNLRKCHPNQMADGFESWIPEFHELKKKKKSTVKLSAYVVPKGTMLCDSLIYVKTI